MKAVITTAYGTPEVLKFEEVDTPIAQTNEILVKIYASSITRADAMMRSGENFVGRLLLGYSKPKNPIWGTGFAGVVQAVGPTVSKFKVGDKVFGESVNKFGAYAEYIAINEDGIVTHLPETLSYDEAACLGDGGVTSLNFLSNVCKVTAGDKVLINGASGALGTSAVQIAKYLGAEVTGVCSTKNLALVKELGADHVIDYTKEDFTRNRNFYDCIYDTVGRSSFAESKNSLTPKGIYATPVIGSKTLFDMVITGLFSDKKAKFSATGALPKKETKRLVKELVAMAEDGGYKSVIDRTYRLEEVAEAHYHIDEGHKRGNVILRPAE